MAFRFRHLTLRCSSVRGAGGGEASCLQRGLRRSVSRVRDCEYSVATALSRRLSPPKFWARNIIAGIVVGLVALPLAMAFAIASGAKPEQGIYTAIITGAVAAIAGGSRLQITGPTGAFIVILAGITSKYRLRRSSVSDPDGGHSSRHHGRNQARQFGQVYPRPRDRRVYGWHRRNYLGGAVALLLRGAQA